MSRKRQAEILYQKIQDAYKPTYFPTKEEKVEALFELENLLFKKVDEVSIIQKARHLADIHGDVKMKVSALITNRFWTMESQSNIKANKYIPEH